MGLRGEDSIGEVSSALTSNGKIALGSFVGLPLTTLTVDPRTATDVARSAHERRSE
jgi:hypothetical protein